MTLGIYGSGGLGREVLELARDINKESRIWDKIIFIDDSQLLRTVNNTKVFTFDEAQGEFSADSVVIAIAVGEPEIRSTLYKKVKLAGFELETLIHPASKVCTGTQIGRGSIVCYCCYISCNVKIGNNVYIQPHASVGHDTVINDNSIISSYVSLAGACSVGSETYIGMSVPVREHVSIGSKTIVGMGSIVLRDIPDNVVALGNPARAMKPNESGRVFK